MTDRSRLDEPPGAAAAPTPSVKGAHVLVVDDQAIVREFLSEVLRLNGHRVTVADSGQAAIEVARRDPPQVLLTDLKMDGMSGEDLIRIIRDVHPAIVSVVVTGFGTVERTVDLMRRGAFDVLTKPCPAGEILATVAVVVQAVAAAELDRFELRAIRDRAAARLEASIALTCSAAAGAHAQRELAGRGLPFTPLALAKPERGIGRVNAPQARRALTDRAGLSLEWHVGEHAASEQQPRCGPTDGDEARGGHGGRVSSPLPPEE